MNLYLTNLRWVCDLERHREEEGDRKGNKVVQEYVMLQKMRHKCPLSRTVLLKLIAVAGQMQTSNNNKCTEKPSPSLPLQ